MGLFIEMSLCYERHDENLIKKVWIGPNIQTLVQAT